jgi:hypothetical protein
MIAYNVTINVHDSIQENWVKWMKETHLPQVMATGMFTSHAMFKLLSRQEDEEGTTYVIQYFANSEADYERYKNEFAPALQAETQKLFAGKFHAFRTLMERVV